MTASRAARQALLAEIGAEGQAHIQAATAIVTAPGLSGEVEAHYLAGAGFGLIRTAATAASRAARETNPEVAISADADQVAIPEALADELATIITDPSALAIAQGAARALRQIRVAARIDVMPVLPKRADLPS